MLVLEVSILEQKISILEQVTLSKGDSLTGLGTRKINHEKVLALSDKDFEQYYLELMTEYKNKNGWWNSGDPELIPKCIKCHEIISGPEQLRRYNGRSLHPNCFRKEWDNEKRSYNNHILKRYFDRVANLQLGT